MNEPAELSTFQKTLNERIEKLERIRNEPEYFIACVTHYRKNPADFITDWLLTVDPRKNPPIMPFLLWEKQKEFIEWLYDCWIDRHDGLCEKSRDSGATWLCAAFSLWLWLFHDSQIIGFGSRKEDLVDKRGDPDSILEKIRFMLENLPSEFVPSSFEPSKHSNYLRIVNPDNESVIKGEGGYNIGRGGRTSVYFKDESAFYEQPDRIEAALSQNSDVKIDISTPNGVGNPFYRKRFGGHIPIFTFHWKDDPRKDQAWYDKQKQLLDPVILAQEIDIDYNASVDNAFIEPDLIDDAQSNRSTDFQVHNEPLVLGVDVARYGADKSVICARQGRVVHYFRSFAKLDTMQLVGEVSNILNYTDTPIRAIFIDVIGIGAGVFDRLSEVYEGLCYPVQVSESSKFSYYKNKRTEIWAGMRDWFKNKPVSLPNDAKIRAEICALQYNYNSSGMLELESKDAAKKRGVKSPDHADALALTFAIPSHMIASADDVNYETETFDSSRNATTGY